MNRDSSHYEVHPLLLHGNFQADPASVAWATLSGLQQNSIQDPEQQALCLQYFQESLSELRQLKDTVSQSEAAKIYQQATQMPGIGQTIDALFSPAALPSTISSSAAAIVAARLNTSVGGLLDIDSDKLQRLKSWGARSGVGVKSAKLNFPDLKITKIDGQWMFEVPAKRLKMYKIKNVDVAKRVVRLRVGKGLTFEDLMKTAKVTSNGLEDLSLAGKFMRLTPSGVLSIGPQMILDAIDAKSWHNFLYLEAHNQTGNILSTFVCFGIGIALGGAIAIPVILGILAIGVVITVACNHHFLGNRSLNQWVGDHLTSQTWR